MLALGGGGLSYERGTLVPSAESQSVALQAISSSSMKHCFHTGIVFQLSRLTLLSTTAFAVVPQSMLSYFHAVLHKVIFSLFPQPLSLSLLFSSLIQRHFSFGPSCQERKILTIDNTD